MRQIINKYMPSARVVSFIIFALCLWQIYVFYHIGFSHGEAYAIANVVNNAQAEHQVLKSSINNCILNSSKSIETTKR